MRRYFLGILVAIAVATTAHPSHATTIAVTTTTDELDADGDCSLREAVRAANGNVAVDACPAGQNDQTDTITVPAGTYTLTIAGNDNDATAGDLDILDNAAAKDLVLNGAGAATTIIQACAVDQRSTPCPAGQGIVDRVFHIRDANVAISGVTIRHGVAPRVNSVLPGSGIYSQRAILPPTLTLTDVVVTRNGITAYDGLSIQGGGILNEYGGHLTLTRVTVSENADNSGTGGAGIVNLGTNNNAADPATLVMTDSTVRDNIGTLSRGSIRNLDGATATLTGCTISGNTAGGFVNGISSTATLTNCTVSGNQSNAGAAGISNSGTFNLRSSTVTLNNRILGPSGPDAGGIVNSNTFVIRNSIVAGNLHYETNPNSSSPDCLDINAPGGLTSEGFSLVGDGKHCPGLVDAVHGDQIGTQGAVIDPKLGPLADNGGPTLTHALLAGSLAIGGGDPATPGSSGTACPTTDQRGEPRPEGAVCDIGSFEGGGAGAIGATAVSPARGGTAGTVQVSVKGSGFVSGAVVRLVRAGFADVVGGVTSARAAVIATSLDLRNAAPGVWSVEVENPDHSVATLTDAFTVEAGGQPDVWVKLLVPPAFNTGRVQSIFVYFGNRGTVDAYGVPLWTAFSDDLRFFIPFAVSPPPEQPGQIATDWSRVAIDVTRPASPEMPEIANAFHFLLPVVPAGSTGVLRFRVKSPIFLEPEDPGIPAFIDVATDIRAPYFQPDLSEDVVAFYVSQAKQYAVSAHGTTTFPSDAAIAAYVRTQLADVVTEGRLAAVTNGIGNPPVYSQTQLIIDTGQFIAGESETASATLGDRGWLARIMSQLVAGPAEARLRDPCAGVNDVFEYINCEAETNPCKHGCPDDAPLAPPPLVCDGEVKKIADFLGIPCKPQPDRVPFHVPRDPNYKAGSGGPGGFIDGVTPINYTVTFENVANATGDAFEVKVTDQLDVSKYDLATFSLGPISFANKFVPVPPGLQSYSTEVDMRPGVNILVGVDAALDTQTGIVTWKFTTLDPATHEFPEDPVDGFLPPNVTSPEGEGEMLFTVSLKPGFGIGTTVCNDASIVFDFNQPIVTNDFCSTIGAPEDCENCIDDDGDGKIDRADPDCAAPADGGGAGVGDATVGKAVDKCAKAIRKAGDKITSTHLKQLGACQKAVVDCVQLKPGDAACLAKATAKCTKARGALPGTDAKLTAAITKACAESAVLTGHLLDASGLGFEHEIEACGQRGLADVATLADVTECVRRQHVCAAERMLGRAVPRARELLVLGGYDPLADLGCVPSGANGGGAAIAPEKRKALRKCDAALQKAAGKLSSGRANALEACGAAVFTCVQAKPGDASCVQKAGGACAKAVGALPKLTAGFTAAIAKACAAPLTPGDLLAATGLGASALGETCAKLGVASLATVADVSTCLERQIACDARQQIENATPRLQELLDLGGVALP